MKRTIIILSTLLTITFVNGQSIDSIQVFEWNNIFNIKIEGTNPSTGEYISNIEYEVIDNEINIDLFFIHCAGYTVLTPYDTIIDLGILTSQNYLITCRTINDINLDSTNCFPNYELTIIDSLTFFYNPLGITNEAPIENKINIYPNPFNDFIIVEVNDVNNVSSIVITDLNGKIIRNVKSINTNQRIDFFDINEGVYIIKILTQDNREIIRRAIKI